MYQERKLLGLKIAIQLRVGLPNEVVSLMFWKVYPIYLLWTITIWNLLALSPHVLAPNTIFVETSLQKRHDPCSRAFWMIDLWRFNKNHILQQFDASKIDSLPCSIIRADLPLSPISCPPPLTGKVLYLSEESSKQKKLNCQRTPVT